MGPCKFDVSGLCKNITYEKGAYKAKLVIIIAKPVVDSDLCTCCETCVDICPGVFEIDYDGRSHVKNPDACNKCDCQEAIDNCPVEAISWEE